MVLCCGRTGGVAQVWRGWVFGDWFAGRIKGKSVFTPMQWKNMSQKMPEDWRSRQTIFISQRFYSSFPPSLFRSILTLQLKNAYPGLRRFSWKFSLRERERAAKRRKRVAEGRGEREGFFFSLFATRGSLSLKRRKISRNWTCGTIASVRAFSYNVYEITALLFYKMYR